MSSLQCLLALLDFLCCVNTLGSFSFVLIICGNCRAKCLCNTVAVSSHDLPTRPAVNNHGWGGISRLHFMSGLISWAVALHYKIARDGSGSTQLQKTPENAPEYSERAGLSRRLPLSVKCLVFYISGVCYGFSRILTEWWQWRPAWSDREPLGKPQCSAIVAVAIVSWNELSWCWSSDLLRVGRGWKAKVIIVGLCGVSNGGHNEERVVPHLHVYHLFLEFNLDQCLRCCWSCGHTHM